jgi:hypothetical protein
VTEPARVRVVSTTEFVILPAVKVPVPFVTGVPLGLPALSVSILKEKVAEGDQNLINEAFKVVLATPLQNTGNEIRVFAVTSPSRLITAFTRVSVVI